MTELPTYFEHELTPGKPMFRCERMSASMTVDACVARWRAAEGGSTCAKCELGRVHATCGSAVSTLGSPRRKGASAKSGVCLRCGGSGVRIIVSTGVCVSCANRSAEFVKGRNSKGKAPIMYRPLIDIEVALQHQDGCIEHRLMEAAHPAEAVARVLREGLGSARFVEAPRPGPSACNTKTQHHEYTCARCGVAGLVLERVRKGVLERHSWCCEGDPRGEGWQLAEVRRPLLGLHPEAQAALMDGDPELRDEVPNSWTGLPAWCAACRRGQLQGMLTSPGGRWRVKCDACGVTSAEGTTT